MVLHVLQKGHDLHPQLLWNFVMDEELVYMHWFQFELWNDDITLVNNTEDRPKDERVRPTRNQHDDDPIDSLQTCQRGNVPVTHRC